jgi:hypothetical protein
MNSQPQSFSTGAKIRVVWEETSPETATDWLLKAFDMLLRETTDPPNRGQLDNSAASDDKERK